MIKLKEIILENLKPNEMIKLKSISELKRFFNSNSCILDFIKYNENNFEKILENSFNCFYIDDWQFTLVGCKKSSKKKKGNGQGTIYFDNTRQCWVGQHTYNGKRQPAIYQHKGETKTNFIARFNKILVSINNGTYILKNKETLYAILQRHIEQKYKDGITKDRAYVRNLETLKAIEKSCNNFIYKPIQQITVEDIEDSKEKIRNYKKSSIDKIWAMLSKGFRIAVSRKRIVFNPMNDENLIKPISKKTFEKVTPLTSEEEQRLIKVLDGPERNHKYRNIVKLELLTAMRIGEVLAISTDDILKTVENKNIIHVHNTLTTDKNNKVILGGHTKTYDKTTGIDHGIRDFPVNKEINEILNEQIYKKTSNIHKLIFWNYERNEFITPQEVNSWLYRLNTKYKISPKLHNHKLRHTRITRWKEHGMDMAAIQYLAGHVENSKVTNDVYIDISREFAFNELKKVTKNATA